MGTKVARRRVTLGSYMQLPERSQNADPRAPSKQRSRSSTVFGLSTLRVAFVCALGVLTLQLAALIIYSEVQYSRFDLSIDFSSYQQAAYLITRGDLNPYSTPFSYPFLHDHFALLMWPLALIYAIFPHGITLLVLQDLASVIAEAVALLWVVEIIEHRLATSGGGKAVSIGILLGTLILLVADPWFYQAASFDFHLEAFATLFVLLALRAAWRQKMAHALGWCIPLLLCGDTGGLYLAGIGASLLVVRNRRLWGLGAMAAGFAWIKITDVLGVSSNSFLTLYSYLIGPGAKVTLASLARTLVRHPHRWLVIVWQRRSLVYQNVIPTGIVGVFSPWGFGIAAIILLSSTLIAPTIFLISGFQDLVLFLATLAPSAMVFSGLLTHPRRRVQVLGALLGLGIVVQAIGYGAVELPRVPKMWIQLSSTQGSELGHVLQKTPQNAEVIAEWGVMGRFAARQWIYPLHSTPQTFPIHSRQVIFVLVPYRGNEPLQPTTALEIVTYLRNDLHATPWVSNRNTFVFSWAPGRLSQVTLP